MLSLRSVLSHVLLLSLVSAKAPVCRPLTSKSLTNGWSEILSSTTPAYTWSSSSTSTTTWEESSSSSTTTSDTTSETPTTYSTTDSSTTTSEPQTTSTSSTSTDSTTTSSTSTDATTTSSSSTSTSTSSSSTTTTSETTSSSSSSSSSSSTTTTETTTSSSSSSSSTTTTESTTSSSSSSSSSTTTESTTTSSSSSSSSTTTTESTTTSSSSTTTTSSSSTTTTSAAPTPPLCNPGETGQKCHGVNGLNYQYACGGTITSGSIRFGPETGYADYTSCLNRCADEPLTYDSANNVYYINCAAFDFDQNAGTCTGYYGGSATTAFDDYHVRGYWVCQSPNADCANSCSPDNKRGLGGLGRNVTMVATGPLSF